MKLLNIKHDAGTVVATYQASHSTPGREGTTLTFDVHLRVSGDGTASVSVDLGPAHAPGVPQGLNQMAVWLQRASLALQNLPPQTASLPLFQKS